MITPWSLKNLVNDLRSSAEGRDLKVVYNAARLFDDRVLFKIIAFLDFLPTFRTITELELKKKDTFYPDFTFLGNSVTGHIRRSPVSLKRKLRKKPHDALRACKRKRVAKSCKQ